ncbi:hypothetical protein BDZ85DRAFT_70448 [Elsinoe ampelina]|uniref:Uncharacterized protein n=1 Tax=Elsinoe ampelina TaxID=302913 RepID=A0A6A6GJ07_9PEZI|nr:hypothetical protein BDZ85DRAFT_70448 [Elsinoe ampelina]
MTGLQVVAAEMECQRSPLMKCNGLIRPGPEVSWRLGREFRDTTTKEARWRTSSTEGGDLVRASHYLMRMIIEWLVLLFYTADVMAIVAVLGCNPNFEPINIRFLQPRTPPMSMSNCILTSLASRFRLPLLFYITAEAVILLAAQRLFDLIPVARHACQLKLTALTCGGFARADQTQAMWSEMFTFAITLDLG